MNVSIGFEFHCVQERDARASRRVAIEAIKNFSEESFFNYFNTFNDTVTNSSFGQGANNNYDCTFHPLDKVVELYELLVQAEKDKVEYLEKLLNGK